MLSAQVGKLFLAERVPHLKNDFSTTNISGEYEFEQGNSNTTVETQTPFHSDVEYAYFIFGALSVLGGVVHVFGWFHSGCKFSHWNQNTEGEAQSTTSQNLQIYNLTKFNFVIASCLLCIFVFVCVINGTNFAGFIIIFAVDTLNWTKIDASNLITVVFVSDIVSKSVSIVCAKFVHVHKLMIVGSLLCVGGTLLMTLLLNITTFCLWTGAALLGLGIGNMVANSLNAGKRLTSQAGVIVSFILTSGYTGQIVAPLLTGFLLDNVGVMWFLYLSVVCSGVSFLLLVAYLVVLCNQRKESVKQECDVPLENKTSDV